MRQAAVYIMANQRNGTLYIGVTSHLIQRIWQHKQGLGCDFTAKHDLNLLVWYELHDNIIAAITREKQLKKWKRSWKLHLIETRNPDWVDLWPQIIA
ncbi:GIY-YIG nuclease family protein [Paralysiella testudinis]|uniref:GIY-YIG nuclease family protein n=1 Tax=Paralysiella testudinis TaxID=2809020 RepID=A0A892ZCH7_9NEIS|nr:GIY-YIG nuclease family protein [Paralysiella testudinis]QRQ81005.1 GIY-YIG nuclease family protein [Paralysiella testudinis]